MMGGRAERASDALKGLGFESADFYKGSLTDWKAKGGQTEKGAE